MKKLFLICMLAINIVSYAQNGVAINTTGAAANNNAILDVSATNKGLLAPRVNLVSLTGDVVTSFGISATPTTSLLVYNTTASAVFQTGFYFWDGSLWTKLNTGATSSVANAWSLTGNASTTASNFIGTTDALPLSLRTTGLDRMTVAANGNVGIGTTAPVRKLHIVSGAEALRIEGTNNWIGFAESALGTYNGYLYQTASNFILGTISGSTKNIQISPKGIPALTAAQNGYIGIGTTTPQAFLEIKGASTPLFNPTLKLVETSSYGYSRLHFTNTSATGNSEFYIKARNTIIPADDRLSFQNSFSGVNMTITGEGKVGIGTETPEDKFAVFTPPNNAGITHTDGDIKFATYLIGTGTSDYGAQLGTMTNHPLHFYTNNSSAQATLLQNGNLGIGTTTPTRPLSFPATFGKKISLYPGGSGDLGMAVFGNELRFFSDYAGADITFGYDNYTGGFTERMRVRGNGDVFIGTNNLTSGAGYKLRVGGKIFSEEVRVQLQSAWPDYVFDKKYKKLSLEELEKYVNENNHLPNIPSAAEVEKDGQHLGEIQRKMLEKIEELSLYVIELKKEIELLKDKK
jgi:uncharacterized protein YaiE (UPF0345 family)